MGELETLNRSLFLLINGGADAPQWLVLLAIGIAKGLIFLLPVLMLGFWLWGHRGERRLVLKATLVTVIALVVNQVIWAVWPHPRPFMIGLGHNWMLHAPDSSFPSDHMTVFACMGLTLLLDGLSGWGVVILVTGLSVAWARVFLGVHFPLDMVGAVIVSFLVYSGLSPIWRRIGRPVTDLAERYYRSLMAVPIRAGWLRG
ncbi:phosphatase PAP2 family protein [Pseudomonas putida]|uniref:undecaprenyl-diphosphate phosphatase n=1 Tax=Pseudomonas putida TaxID=303 RepID=A0A6I6XRW6_PSEPU|nr:phosphatase PAP2 family protein [Pseudomonas putida]QHG64118.1 phosphatase PAP2 family protein [Pseudomonas putida]